MRHKNPFVLLYGPADSEGRLAVTRDELIGQAEEEIRLAPMDFYHPREDFNGSLSVEVLDQRRVQAALRAYETWSSVSQYPPGYRRALEKVLQRLTELDGAELSAEVSIGQTG